MCLVNKALLQGQLDHLASFLKNMLVGGNRGYEDNFTEVSHLNTDYLPVSW